MYLRFGYRAAVLIHITLAVATNALFHPIRQFRRPPGNMATRPLNGKGPGLEQNRFLGIIIVVLLLRGHRHRITAAVSLGCINNQTKQTIMKNFQTNKNDESTWHISIPDHKNKQTNEENVPEFVPRTRAARVNHPSLDCGGCDVLVVVVAVAVVRGRGTIRDVVVVLLHNADDSAVRLARAHAGSG